MFTYVKDLLERIVATFALAFLTLWLAAPSSVDTAKAAGLAGIVAAGSLVKGLLAKFLATPDTASLAPGV
jgi:hypothetical protein